MHKELSIERADRMSAFPISPHAPPNSRTFAERLVDTLVSLGCNTVYGVPGAAIEPFYDAIARHQPSGSITAVVARHEASAGFLAQGYAKESGRLGVCCTTTGPGATNIITAVASAFCEETPMLVISGQIAAAKLARGALQDSSFSGIDIVGMMRFCTRYNAQVTDPAQFEPVLAQALLAMYGDPPGPAHLSIAPDVFRAATGKASVRDYSRLMRRARVIDIVQLNRLAAEIEAARGIVLLIGEGCSGAIHEIMAFADRLHIPFVVTPGAKGVVTSQHPLYAGVFGFAGHTQARDLLTRADVELVLAVGARLGEWDTLGDTEALLNERLVHIDNNAAHFKMSHMAKLQIHADLKTLFGALLSRFAPNSADHDLDKDIAFGELPIAISSAHQIVDSGLGVPPPALMQWISDLMQASDCIYVDSGCCTCWGIHHLTSPRSGPVGYDLEWYRLSANFGAMGWAIGNAIGAAMVNPARRFICLLGDGSWLMNGQEFTVAVQHHVPVLFIILNDQAYGMVKHGQRLANAAPIAFEMSAVDFSLIAKAMGGNGFRVNSLSELEALTATLESWTGPTVLDVRIDGEMVPPLHARIKVMGAP